MILSEAVSPKDLQRIGAVIYLHKHLTTLSYLVPSGGSGDVLRETFQCPANISGRLPAPRLLLNLLLCAKILKG